MSVDWRWWLSAGLFAVGLTPPGRQIITEGTNIVRSLANTWNNPPAAIAQFFKNAEAKYRLPTGLLTRMGFQESHWREDIISGHTTSRAGAVGVMQLIPKWHPNIDPLNPMQAIDYAGSFVSSLAKSFGGDFQKAVAAYNWGPGNLQKHIAKTAAAGQNWKTGLPTETANYVQQVFADLMQARLSATA